jgi:RNase H-fold protein (predicted Holliday junction resolvase)
MLRWLEKERRELERDLGHRPIGVAACEVLDSLIRRTRAVTNRMPADAPITLSYIENQMGDEAETLRSVATALARMAELIKQAEDVVYQQRQPFIRLIEPVTNSV